MIFASDQLSNFTCDKRCTNETVATSLTAGAMFLGRGTAVN